MSKREPMSSVDRSWLLMDSPTNRMVINGFFIFDEPLEHERLVQVLSDRLLIHDRFRQRVVESRGAMSTRVYWEIDPHFDLRSHIRHIALPEPGDRKTLEELMSDLLIDPLDPGRPLWEFYLIDGYQGGSVLFGRIHHCIGDGASLVQVLLSLTDSEPDTEWQAPEQGERSKRRGSFLPIPRQASRLLGSALDIGGTIVAESMASIADPSHLVDLAAKGGSVAGKTAGVLGKLALMPTDSKTVIKGEPGVPKAIAWSTAIDLDDVKFVKNRMGATVNDVLMAAMAGALRRYLQERGDDPDGKEIRAMVPVNIRPPEDVKLTNRFALVYIELPVGIADPMDRLFETKRRMDAIKRSPEAVITYQILAGLGIAPGEVSGAFSEYFAGKASAVLTNVPGPAEKRYFAGRRFNTMVFWVPQSGSIGMGISIFSYGGDVILGLITDRGLVPDPESIVAAYHDEFADFYRIAHLPDDELRGVQEVPVIGDAGSLETYQAMKDAAEGGEADRLCRGLTRAGTPCRRRVRPGSHYCYLHLPKESI